ncbi:MAG: hypothetical protein KC731_14280 [Myxococcales bacterium]|nr:hypothetical protein [Myxococcales bacterium]
MKRLGMVGSSLLVLGLGVVAACSAGSGKSEGSQSSGQGAGGGVVGAGSGAGMGTGGGLGHAGGAGQGGEQACQEIDVAAAPLDDAADIIFVIDTSGSMTEEMGFVVDNMNAFSQQIVGSGVDARVIMLARAPFCILNECVPGICVDPPLGSGSCPADENVPAGYYHPQSDINSVDSLSQLVFLYPTYGGNLRTYSRKYIVIVTDDNATFPYINDANAFLDQYVALDPPKLTGVTVHAIYCFDGNGPCENAGTVYEDLVNLTGGIHGDLASQDFQPIFNDVATQVVAEAGVPCQYPIPEPPDQAELDPSKVNVAFTDGDGNIHEILQVAGYGACDPVLGGWYYDDPVNPTAISMCPATCDFVSTDAGGSMDIKFGCATKVLQPE